MNAPGKKLKNKRKKRSRGPRMTFGELLRKLWQPEPEGPEPKIETARKLAGKSKRSRKS